MDFFVQHTLLHSHPFGSVKVKAISIRKFLGLSDFMTKSTSIAIEGVRALGAEDGDGDRAGEMAAHST